MVWHLSGAWRRREHDNVILLHHAAVSADLPGQMAVIATRLGVDVPPHRGPSLIAAATLPSMRARARQLVPDEQIGLLRDPGRFFHNGGAGQWHDLLTPQDLDHYRRRLDQLGTADLTAWMHQRVEGAPDP